MVALEEKKNVVTTILMYVRGFNRKWRSTHVLSFYTHQGKFMCQRHEKKKAPSIA